MNYQMLLEISIKLDVKTMMGILILGNLALAFLTLQYLSLIHI